MARDINLRKELFWRNMSTGAVVVALLGTIFFGLRGHLRQQKNIAENIVQIDKLQSSLTPEERLDFRLSADKNLDQLSKIVFLDPKERDAIMRLSQLTYMSPTDLLLRAMDLQKKTIGLEQTTILKSSLGDWTEMPESLRQDIITISRFNSSFVHTEAYDEIFERIYNNRFLDLTNPTLRSKLDNLIYIYDQFAPSPKPNTRELIELRNERLKEFEKARQSEARRVFEKRQREKLANAKKDFGKLKALRTLNKPRHFA